jgi:predicted nucleic acid-binding protein
LAFGWTASRRPSLTASYPIDAATARRWGELSAIPSLPVIDTLIAATAISHGLTLVTRNTRDVESTGVPLVDPWQSR